MSVWSFVVETQRKLVKTVGVSSFEKVVILLSIRWIHVNVSGNGNHVYQVANDTDTSFRAWIAAQSTIGNGEVSSS